ncbi:MFS transporter [Virgibacillus doumboii]|uniref:MFS transporter n=1 Tax=Virgibacillus doumboii TaxID=2697503 RepID=UPI001FE82D74|nr:MFS transporter [Virgibacillus doumboii]
MNGIIILTNHAFLGMLLRVLTGLTLAGVYPVAVKILSQWFPKKRGLAVGILIAALTLGTSLPHFAVIFFSSINWQLVIICSSVLALFAAIIVHFMLEDAPAATKKSTFSFTLIIQEVIGWQWVFAILAIGPVLGIVSMVKYKRYEVKGVESA